MNSFKASFPFGILPFFQVNSGQAKWSSIETAALAKKSLQHLTKATFSLSAYKWWRQFGSGVMTTGPNKLGLNSVLYHRLRVAHKIECNFYPLFQLHQSFVGNFCSVWTTHIPSHLDTSDRMMFYLTSYPELWLTYGQYNSKHGPCSLLSFLSP